MLFGLGAGLPCAVVSDADAAGKASSRRLRSFVSFAAFLWTTASACGPKPVVEDTSVLDSSAADSAVVVDSGLRAEDLITIDDDAVAALNPATLPQAASPCRPPILVRITYITDGDTVHAVGLNEDFSRSVRFIGVNAPEIAHPPSPAECFGNEATTFTRQLDQHLAWLTFDKECTDRFDRALAFVFVGPAPEGFWNRQMALRGYARQLTVAPNNTFANTFRTDVDNAKNSRLGVWGACGQ